jgi:hypothetical protein
MKAKIRTIGAILRIALTDHQDGDRVVASSGFEYRPLTLQVTYSEGYEHGFTWTLYCRRIKKDGTLGTAELIGDRYIISSMAPALEVRMDRLAERSNPTAALERALDRNAVCDV